MITDISETIPVIFQIAVLMVLLFLSVRLIRESDRSLTAVFLVFLHSIWLLTDLYWVMALGPSRPATAKPTNMMP